LVKFYLLAIILDENFVARGEKSIYRKIKFQEIMSFVSKK